jgi:bacterioferritin-associated ferredoxin
MIVCVCRRVSDRDIARAVKQGCASFDELQFELGVATGCGACRDCAKDVFRRARSAQGAEIDTQAGTRPLPVRMLQPA